MTHKKFTVHNTQVNYYLDTKFTQLTSLVAKMKAVIITDENVYKLHQTKFKGWNCIVVPAGESHKQQATVDNIIQQLVTMQADRTTTIVGIGGGVVTDMASYTAAVYMRGVACILVPTTLLAMVDASIGGKNGVDVGDYKNLVGTIKQPNALLFDYSFLKTLPELEWQNGFAEIIKHACIRDAAMFRQLAANNIAFYQKKKADLAALIQRNVLLKNKVIQIDPLEQDIRKQLNFGHTIGHAIENKLQISHGYAVAIGMVYAAYFSASVLGFKHSLKIIELLEQYQLPTHAETNVEDIAQMILLDKKRVSNDIHFVLLQKIGSAQIVPLSLVQIKQLLKDSAAL